MKIKDRTTAAQPAPRQAYKETFDDIQVSTHRPPFFKFPRAATDGCARTVRVHATEARGCRAREAFASPGACRWWLSTRQLQPPSWPRELHHQHGSQATGQCCSCQGQGRVFRASFVLSPVCCWQAERTCRSGQRREVEVVGINSRLIFQTIGILDRKLLYTEL